MADDEGVEPVDAKRWNDLVQRFQDVIIEEGYKPAEVIEACSRLTGTAIRMVSGGQPRALEVNIKYVKGVVDRHARGQCGCQKRDGE